MSPEITIEPCTERSDRVYFIDSVVLAAAALKRDAMHKKASEILRRLIASGSKACFSDFILAETLTLIRFSGRGGAEASNRAHEILTSTKTLELTRLTDRELELAAELFKKYPQLSFVDATTVALMYSRKIKRILSFDQDFDSVPGIERIEEIGLGR